MPKIIVTTSSFAKSDDSPLRICREEGLEVVLNPYGRKVTSEELIELAKGAVGIIAGTELLNDEIFSRLSALKVISRCGTGLDNVDIFAAEKRGIKVFNTPEGPTLAVAELTVALILGLIRRVNRMDLALKNGKWEKAMGNLLSGKKVGIIGFGRIGQKVAELLAGFNTELAYYDLDLKPCRINCRKKDFDEILSGSDIITLHISSPAGNKPLIGEKEFSMIKKGSWLINTSRGGAIDEKALYNALKSGRIAGAALDVFEKEPYAGPLKEFENVILTPHIGSYAEESRVKMEIEAVNNLIKGLGASS